MDYEWDENPPVESQTFYKEQDAQRGNRDQYYNDRGSRDQQHYSDRGNRSQQYNSWGNRDQQYGKPRNDRFSSGGSRQWRDQNPSDNNYEQKGDSQKQTIKVPSRFVGRIIGRGGSKISDLQFESGCRINVTKEQEGDETLVVLTGDEKSRQKAEGLINELTVDRGDKFVLRTCDPSNESSAYSADNAEPEVIDWGKLSEECDRHQAEKWAKFPPIKKEFYQEHPEVTAMSETEVRKWRLECNNIVVSRAFGDDKDTDKPILKPVKTFEHAFHNYPEILGEIKKAGFEKPSPIQCQAWPVLLNGEDLIGIAQTGTGKTLAFLLPALIHIDGQCVTRQERGGPACLVIAPTRELALQIDREVKKYYYRGITAVCIYGGGNRREQVKIVTDGVDIIIATPGRLNDLVVGGHINLNSITYVVLDEADRMLDMGFEPQIRKVMYSIRPNRQTVMTSATWPSCVRRLASSYMVDPVQVYVGSLDLAAVHSVTQTIQMMSDDESEKFQVFMEFVRNMQRDHKAIVFCGKKVRADYLASELVINGIDCQTIHGDREQCDREQALVDIASGAVQLLIATDVASRGLDIEDITHVVNYDFPRNIEEYVHRVGRTGRAGRTGESISFFTRSDWSQAKELISILEEAQQYVPTELFDMSKRYEAWKQRKDTERGGRFGGGGGRGGGGGGGRRDRW